MGCGLLLTTSCTSGRKAQLKAAVEEINKSCPASIANGVIFQEITFSEGAVDNAAGQTQGETSTANDNKQQTGDNKQPKGDNKQQTGDGGVVDMFYVIQENTITIPITEESLPTWKSNFVDLFAGMVHADASMQALFELIGDTNSAFTITLMLVPSQTKYVIALTHEDIQHILSVNNIKK